MPSKWIASEVLDAAGDDDDLEQYDINGDVVFKYIEECTRKKLLLP